MPTVAASEEGRAQTTYLRVCGVEDRHNQSHAYLKYLEWYTIACDSHVGDRQSGEAGIQSTAEHEEFCGKQGGPPSKAKH